MADCRNTMYERLTERNANGTAKSRISATCREDAWQIETDILDRLCEIEDKICEGRMVELQNSNEELGKHCTENGKRAKTMAKNNAPIWLENLEKLKNGAFGSVENPDECCNTLARYWKAQAEAGYPYAVQNMLYFEEMARRGNEKTSLNH